MRTKHSSSFAVPELGGISDKAARFLGDFTFRKACLIAGVEPTVRQASKYLQSRGEAYACKFQAQIALGTV